MFSPEENVSGGWVGWGWPGPPYPPPPSGLQVMACPQSTAPQQEKGLGRSGGCNKARRPRQGRPHDWVWGPGSGGTKHGVLKVPPPRVTLGELEPPGSCVTSSTCEQRDHGCQGSSTLGMFGHHDGLGKPPGFFQAPKISEN